MPKRYVPIYRVELVRERRKKLKAKKVCSPEEAARVVRDYLREPDREVFVILALSTKNEVIGINTVSIGTLDASLVHPREVYKPAILLNASSVIVAHNHPSGDPTPSREDRDVSNRLFEAGKILGVDLLDHIVVVAEGYASLKQLGML